MTIQHIVQYFAGGLLFLFGLASLFTGWVPADTAIGFVLSGGSVFGLTAQNQALAGAVKSGKIY